MHARFAGARALVLAVAAGFNMFAATTFWATCIDLTEEFTGSLSGLMNTFGIRLVALLNDISVWWHILGVAIIVAVLLIVPDHHQSWSFTFTKFVNNTGFGFGGAPIYVFLIGLLLAQYTFTGYDASAHLTEENRHAYADLNVDKILTKPFDVRELREVIDTLAKVA